MPELKDLYRSLINDPDIVPPKNTDRKAYVLNLAQQRLRQFHNNEQALELGYNSAVAKLSMFVAASPEAAPKIFLEKASLITNDAIKNLIGKGFSAVAITRIIEQASEVDIKDDNLADAFSIRHAQKPELRIPSAADKTPYDLMTAYYDELAKIDAEKPTERTSQQEIRIWNARRMDVELSKKRAHAEHLAKEALVGKDFTWPSQKEITDGVKWQTTQKRKRTLGESTSNKIVTPTFKNIKEAAEARSRARRTSADSTSEKPNTGTAARPPEISDAVKNLRTVEGGSAAEESFTKLKNKLNENGEESYSEGTLYEQIANLLVNVYKDTQKLLRARDDQVDVLEDRLIFNKGLLQLHMDEVHERGVPGHTQLIPQGSFDQGWSETILNAVREQIDTEELPVPADTDSELDQSDEEWYTNILDSYLPTPSSVQIAERSPRSTRRTGDPQRTSETQSTGDQSTAAQLTAESAQRLEAAGITGEDALNITTDAQVDEAIEAKRIRDEAASAADTDGAMTEAHPVDEYINRGKVAFRIAYDALATDEQKAAFIAHLTDKSNNGSDKINAGGAAQTNVLAATAAATTPVEEPIPEVTNLDDLTQGLVDDGTFKTIDNANFLLNNLGSEKFNKLIDYIKESNKNASYEPYVLEDENMSNASILLEANDVLEWSDYGDRAVDAKLLEHSGQMLDLMSSEEFETLRTSLTPAGEEMTSIGLTLRHIKDKLNLGDNEPITLEHTKDHTNVDSIMATKVYSAPAIEEEVRQSGAAQEEQAVTDPNARQEGESAVDHFKRVAVANNWSTLNPAAAIAATFSDEDFKEPEDPAAAEQWESPLDQLRLAVAERVRLDDTVANQGRLQGRSTAVVSQFKTLTGSRAMEKIKAHVGDRGTFDSSHADMEAIKNESNPVAAANAWIADPNNAEGGVFAPAPVETEPSVGQSAEEQRAAAHDKIRTYVETQGGSFNAENADFKAAFNDIDFSHDEEGAEAFIDEHLKDTDLPDYFRAEEPPPPRTQASQADIRDLKQRMQALYTAPNSGLDIDAWTADLGEQEGSTRADHLAFLDNVDLNTGGLSLEELTAHVDAFRDNTDDVMRNISRVRNPNGSIHVEEAPADPVEAPVVTEENLNPTAQAGLDAIREIEIRGEQPQSVFGNYRPSIHKHLKEFGLIDDLNEPTELGAKYFEAVGAVEKKTRQIFNDNKATLFDNFRTFARDNPNRDDRYRAPNAWQDSDKMSLASFLGFITQLHKAGHNKIRGVEYGNGEIKFERNAKEDEPNYFNLDTEAVKNLDMASMFMNGIIMGKTGVRYGLNISDPSTDIISQFGESIPLLKTLFTEAQIEDFQEAQQQLGQPLTDRTISQRTTDGPTTEGEGTVARPSGEGERTGGPQVRGRHRELNADELVDKLIESGKFPKLTHENAGEYSLAELKTAYKLIRPPLEQLEDIKAPEEEGQATEDGYDEDKAFTLLAQLQNPNVEVGTHAFNTALENLKGEAVYNPIFTPTERKAELKRAIKAAHGSATNDRKQTQEANRNKLDGSDERRIQAEFDRDFPEPEEGMAASDIKVKMRALVNFNRRKDVHPHAYQETKEAQDLANQFAARFKQYAELNPEGAKELETEIDEAIAEGRDIGSPEFLTHLTEQDSQAYAQAKKALNIANAHQARVKDAMEQKLHRSIRGGEHHVMGESPRELAEGEHPYGEEWQDAPAPQAHGIDEETGEHDPEVQQVINDVHQAKLALGEHGERLGAHHRAINDEQRLITDAHSRAYDDARTARREGHATLNAEEQALRREHGERTNATRKGGTVETALSEAYDQIEGETIAAHNELDQMGGEQPVARDENKRFTQTVNLEPQPKDDPDEEYQRLWQDSLENRHLFDLGADHSIDGARSGEQDTLPEQFSEWRDTILGELAQRHEQEKKSSSYSPLAGRESSIERQQNVEGLARLAEQHQRERDWINTRVAEVEGEVTEAHSTHQQGRQSLINEIENTRKTSTKEAEDAYYQGMSEHKSNLQRIEEKLKTFTQSRQEQEQEFNTATEDIAATRTAAEEQLQKKGDQGEIALKLPEGEAKLQHVKAQAALVKKLKPKRAAEVNAHPDMGKSAKTVQNEFSASIQGDTGTKDEQGTTKKGTRRIVDVPGSKTGEQKTQIFLPGQGLGWLDEETYNSHMGNHQEAHGKNEMVIYPKDSVGSHGPFGVHGKDVHAMYQPENSDLLTDEDISAQALHNVHGNDPRMQEGTPFNVPVLDHMRQEKPQGFLGRMFGGGKDQSKEDKSPVRPYTGAKNELDHMREGGGGFWQGVADRMQQQRTSDAVGPANLQDELLGHLGAKGNALASLAALATGNTKKFKAFKRTAEARRAQESANKSAKSESKIQGLVALTQARTAGIKADSPQELNQKLYGKDSI